MNLTTSPTGGGGGGGGGTSLGSSLLAATRTAAMAAAGPLTTLIKRSLAGYQSDDNEDNDQLMGAGNTNQATYTTLATIDNRLISNSKLIETTTTNNNNNNNNNVAPTLLLEENSQQLEQSFSDWWNDYWSRQPFPSGYTQSSITLLACFITTIIFLIVVGNLLVCIAIFTEKSLKPTQNWFIASLAVSDMLLGLVVMPFSLARELMGFWIFGPLWCDIHEALDVLLTTASINTLCLISLDRYWSITQAVNYLKKRTPRRGAFMIAFVWIFSAAVSLPPLFGWKKQSPSPSSSSSSSSSSTSANNNQPTPGIGGQLNNKNNNNNIQLNTSTREADSIANGGEFLQAVDDEEDRIFATSGGSGHSDTPAHGPADPALEEGARATRQAKHRPARASGPHEPTESSELLHPNENNQPSTRPQSKPATSRIDRHHLPPSTPPTTTTKLKTKTKTKTSPTDSHHDLYGDFIINQQQQRKQQPDNQKHNNAIINGNYNNRHDDQQQQTYTPTLFYELNNDDYDVDRSPGNSNNYQPVRMPIIQSLLQSEQMLATGATGQQLISPTTVNPLIEYPSCQLSGDVGYVIYSALGSFFIPCGVMVFTYIKIFLAARSRARRAINKQSRAQANAEKANRRLAAANQRRTLAGALSEHGHRKPLGDSATGAAMAAAGSQLKANLVDKLTVGESNNNNKKMPADNQMMKGKLVVVERRKSTITPTPGLKQSSAGANNKTDVDKVRVASGASGGGAAADVVDASESTLEPPSVSQNNEPFTITTSGAKQASPSALNGTVTSNDSSMITVMSASMAELPVTRFNFKEEDEYCQRQLSHKRQSSADGSRKAAALLRAIRQAPNEEHNDHDDGLVGQLLAGTSGASVATTTKTVDDNNQSAGEPNEENNKANDNVPEIVVERRLTGTTSGHSIVDDNAKQQQQQQMETVTGSNSTNETCFMTIEEDSDNFDAQTGRTIMMIAGNAKQSNSLVSPKSQGIMMTMMPPTSGGAAPAGANPTGSCQSNSIICNNVACLRQRGGAGGGSGAGTARSGSSYCGSSMTINDEEEEDDEDDEEEEEEDDDDDDECVVDDDMLTDDCNGYSGSCGLDQYCPATTSSTCAHCHECAAEQGLTIKQRGRQHSQSLGGSPMSINKKLAASQQQQQQQHHHQHHRDDCTGGGASGQINLDDQTSMTGDDNLSLTEYRSNDDDENSSVIGHDMLDATERVHSSDKRRKSIIGAGLAMGVGQQATGAVGDQQQQQQQQRKKSSIGQRLARLGSSVPPLSNQSGGLLALAASQHQQTTGASGVQIAGAGLSTTTPATSATRNLKALRQNFFHKLNQLTAKSAAKQNKSRSPFGAGKSSSGSSYEPSVDCATTSNVHSMMENYHQETTFGETDEYEPQTSGETTKDQHSSDQQDQRLIGSSNKGSSNQPRSSMNANESNKRPDNKRNREDEDEVYNDDDEEEEEEEEDDDDHEKSKAMNQKRSSKSTNDESTRKESNHNKSNNRHHQHHGHHHHHRVSHGTATSGVDNERDDGMSETTNRHLISGDDDSAMMASNSAGADKALRLDLGGTLRDQSARISMANSTGGGGGGGGKKSSGPNNMDKCLTMVAANSEGATGGSERAPSGRGGQSQTGNNSRAYLASDNERHKRKLAKARERRATLILGLIMAAFICSWLPFFTFYVLSALCHVCRDYISPRFEAFIFWMGYCNSAINPIIYTIFNRDFRKAFRKILFKCL